MKRKTYNEQYSYEILENGYDIYKDDRKIIEQHDPYGKLFVSGGSYEENCIKQLDEMTAPVPEPEPSPEGGLMETNRADLDYLALMLDIDLPSQSEEV